VRDDEGIYCGHHLCKCWLGVDRTGEIECCGGRKIKIAFIKCGKKGIIQGGECSRSACKEREESR
jgi:hypothetical protein